MEDFSKLFVPENLKITETPLLTLAFYGDAVHTLLVRNYLLKTFANVNNLHKMASTFCSANAQSEMLDKILPMLSEDESDLIRRARNTKTHKPPKSCSLEVYKKATGLEVLFGFLVATKNFERINQLFEKGIQEK